MRIGINTLALVPGRSGGDATYTRYLVEHLAHLDRENKYYLFVAPYNREWFQISQANFHHVLCPIPNSFAFRVLYEHTGLWLSANQMPLDVFHSPVNIAPAFQRHRSVVTAHDSIYALTDQRIPLPLSLYWRIMRPRSARQASQVIVVSETSRQELINAGAVPSERVTVIYNGVHERFHPLDREASIAWARENVGADRPFVLWIGRPYASKNLVRLIEGFAQFNRKIEHRYQLVMVGPSGWEDTAVNQAIETSGVAPDLVKAGYIDNSDLPRLYNAAAALLFPSLKEACPFPPIEAMACGTPVITSNLSALPEIMGGAGELVDPLQIEDIARGLEAVLCNPDYHRELRARGLARARRFSWEENASRTLEVYRQIAGDAG